MDEKLKQLKDYRTDIIKICRCYRSDFCNNYYIKCKNDRKNLDIKRKHEYDQVKTKKKKSIFKERKSIQTILFLLRHSI